MTWDPGALAIGLAAIAAFVAAFRISGLTGLMRAAATVASQAMAAITDKNLDDEEREHLVRNAALRLFGQFVRIALTLFLVLAVPVLVIWLGAVTGLASLEAVSDLLMSWEVIIGATLLILAGVWIGRHR